MKDMTEIHWIFRMIFFGPLILTFFDSELKNPF